MTGPLAETDLATLLAFLFGALVAVCSIVIVAAFVPRRAGPAAGSGAVGGAMIMAAGLITAVLMVALVLSVAHLPTAVAVIAAGLAVLSGPFLVEPLPRHVRESRLALAGVVLISFAALLLLPRPF